jgi:hypothetical protein
MKKTALRRKARLPRRTRLARRATARKQSRAVLAQLKPRTIDQVLTHLVRQYVLLRDGFKCRKCGGTQRSGNRGSILQAAHIYPKGTYRDMQHDPDNVVAMCLKDHLYWWHKHPIEAAEWAKAELGPVVWARLQIMSQTPRKVDKQGMKLLLEQKLAALGWKP